MRLALLLNVVLFGVCFVFGSTADGQEWTRFRGPNGSGISEADGIPSEINESTYRWNLELPGRGHSSPVVWGDKIFLMSSDDDTAERYLICVSAKGGEILWQRTLASQPHHLHSRSSYSSGSPVVDEKHVYFVWAEPDSTMLCAYTHDGEQVWKRDLGPFRSQHGFGGSPIVHDDKVVFFHSQQNDSRGEGELPLTSRMMAFDCLTGETKWETPLKTTRVCYSVPAVFEDPSGKELLVCCNTGNGFFAIDAKNGELKWDLPVFKMRTVASTVIAKDIVFGSNGSGGGGNYLVGVKLGEKPQELFRVTTSANYVPTPIAYEEQLFLFNDNGIVSCVDLETGKERWRKRVAEGFSGSPVRVKDRLYTISEDGTLFVIKADANYQLLSKHPLGEECRSTPAVSGGQMFLRTVSHLIAIGDPS